MAYSPGVTEGVWPTSVTRSRSPFTLSRRTQKPFCPLWKVTRSTKPAILANGAGVPAEEAEVAPAPFGEDVGVGDEG